MRARESDPQSRENLQEREKQTMDKKKILIVDDDTDLRIGINARLRANGYETSFAVDGMTAISVARKECPDLVLLDLGLPGGDGFVVLERMRSHMQLSATPIIVLTARDPESRTGTQAAMETSRPPTTGEG